MQQLSYRLFGSTKERSWAFVENRVRNARCLFEPFRTKNEPECIYVLWVISIRFTTNVSLTCCSLFVHWDALSCTFQTPSELHQVSSSQSVLFPAKAFLKYPFLFTLKQLQFCKSYWHHFDYFNKKPILDTASIACLHWVSVMLVPSVEMGTFW